LTRLGGKEGDRLAVCGARPSANDGREDVGTLESRASRHRPFDRIARVMRADDTLAMKYLKLAAEKDNVHSQNTLANWYFDGRGVIRDESLASYWVQRAANQNYARSQMGLAVLLRKSGDETNMVEALKWLYLAGKWWPGKDENDISTATRMARDLESTMSGAAIDRARRLADAWEPTWE
jgi:TPR repeat protein